MVCGCPCLTWYSLPFFFFFPSSHCFEHCCSGGALFNVLYSLLSVVNPVRGVPQVHLIRGVQSVKERLISTTIMIQGLLLINKKNLEHKFLRWFPALFCLLYSPIFCCFWLFWPLIGGYVSVYANWFSEAPVTALMKFPHTHVCDDSCHSRPGQNQLLLAPSSGRRKRWLIFSFYFHDHQFFYFALNF